MESVLDRSSRPDEVPRWESHVACFRTGPPASVARAESVRTEHKEMQSKEEVCSDQS